MAKIEGGIFGNLYGKVGSVVGAKWNGIRYIRTHVARIKNPKTEKQLMQRSKFSMMGKFIRATFPVTRIGFKHHAGKGKSAYGAAMAYNLDAAVKGEYPNYEIDFGKVALSIGELHSANEVTVAAAHGKLDFAWDTATPNRATAGDRVLLLAYNPARQRSMYDIAGYARAEGTGSLSLPRIWEGEDVEVYIAFASADAELVSDSLYLGRYTVVNE